MLASSSVTVEAECCWQNGWGQDAWQFPQGGVDKGESAEQALFRELYEEVGFKGQRCENCAANQKMVAL